LSMIFHVFSCFFSMMFYSSIWFHPSPGWFLCFQHGNAKHPVFSSPRKADWRGASCYRVWSEEIQEFQNMGFPDWMILVIASWGCFRVLNMGLCIQIIVDLIPPIFCWSEWSEASMMFNSSMFGLVKKTTSEKTCWIQYTIVVELFSLIPISGCPKKWTSHPHSLDQGCRSGSSVFWVTRLGGPVAMGFHWKIGCKIISVVMVYHWSFFLFDYLILSHPLVGEMGGDLDSAAGCLDAEVMGAGPWDFGT
jgi:hypothetical protein